MSNINFFRVMQGGTWKVFSDVPGTPYCGDSTSKDLSSLNTSFTASSNFGVCAVKTGSYSNPDKFLYTTRYVPADTPNNVINQFDFNTVSGDNYGFPRMNRLTDTGNEWGLDSETVVDWGFPGETATSKVGFFQDISVIGANAYSGNNGKILLSAYRFIGGINFTRLYQFDITASFGWDISTINTGSNLTSIKIENDYGTNTSPVPFNHGTFFNHDGTKVFNIQRGRLNTASPINRRTWLTIIPLTTAYDLNSWQSSTTSSINLNDTLPDFSLRNSAPTAVGLTKEANQNQGDMKDYIRIHSQSSGTEDNTYYFEVTSNNTVDDITTTYESTSGGTFFASSMPYRFDSTGSDIPEEDDTVVTMYKGTAQSLVQCDWVATRIVIV